MKFYGIANSQRVWINSNKVKIVNQNAFEIYSLRKTNDGRVDRTLFGGEGHDTKQLAGEIGISPSRANDYISGCSEPTLKLMRLLCQILNISPSAMLGLGGEKLATYKTRIHYILPSLNFCLCKHK